MSLRSMWRLGAVAGVAFGVLVLPAGGESAPERAPTPSPWSGAGPFTPDQIDRTWRDEARGRDVPVRIHWGREAEGPMPLLVYSHGGGGSRSVGTYLAERLASHGYIVIAPQHAGSDRDALRGGRRGPAAMRGARERLRAMVDDPANLRNRPLDVSFVIDRALAGDLPKGLGVDAERIGVLGHSFGAFTAMSVAGMLVDLPEGEDKSFRDDRVRCALALSPQGTGTMGIDAGAWDEIEIPILGMTGTEDSARGGADPTEWRAEWFEAIRARGAEQPAYLAIIEKATHSTFSDTRTRRFGRRRGGEVDERHHAWIQSMATAFFNAHLRSDDAAHDWLASERVEEQTQGEVRFDVAPGD